MADEPLDELELDRFLNDLAAGRAPDGYGLDPAATDAVRHFWRLTRQPMPDPARERIGRALDAEIGRLTSEVSMNGTLPRSMLVPLPIVDTPRAAPHPPTRPFPTVRASFATAALVALVIATAGLGWVAFGSQRAGDRSGGVPAAAVASATPAATVIQLSARIGIVPPGPIWTGIVRNTLDPGIEIGMTTELILVERGSLTVESAVAGELVRRDGTIEPIAAGGTTTLLAGDGAEFSTEGAANPGVSADGFLRLRNLASDSVEFIDASVGAAAPTATFYRGYHTMSLIESTNPRVTFPAEITLRTTTLDPDDEIPGSIGVVTLVCSVDGSGVLATTSGGSYRNVGKTPTDVYALTIVPDTADAATPATSLHRRG